MTSSLRVAATGVVVASLAMAGCSDDSSAAGSGRPQVIASSYPFGFVVEQVGGDLIDAQNLTAPGQEPHDLELSPRQLADLTEADLVVYESGFQPAVDDGLVEADLPEDAVLDVAQFVAVEVTGFSTEHEDEHADEHGEHGGHADHSEEDADEHEGASEGEPDPHVWLDPVRMVEITAAVQDHLIAMDPDNEQTYRDNAAALTAQLEELDAAYEGRLARCERRTIVTGHAAFAYLAERYDLKQVAIAGINPSAEPTPEQQAEVADLVEREGITTVFTEALVSSDVAESIADETGVRLAQLDPIEGLSDGTADQTYLTLMKANLAAIEEANGCS